MKKKQLSLTDLDQKAEAALVALGDALASDVPKRTAPRREADQAWPIGLPGPVDTVPAGG